MRMFCDTDSIPERSNRAYLFNEWYFDKTLFDSSTEFQHFIIMDKSVFHDIDIDINSVCPNKHGNSVTILN